LRKRRETEVILKNAQRIFNIVFLIYVLGTIAGILICLLEVVRRVRFYNYDRLPLWEGNLIIASNHPSWLDVVILPMLYFPWWFRELTARIKYLLTWPLKKKRESISSIFHREFNDIPASTADKHNLRRFWWILEGWNIFINRQEGKAQERSIALRKMINILKHNGRIAIFPGGGRDFKAEENGDGIYDIKTRQLIMRRPKQGIGLVIKQTGATVVPIRLEGTDKVLPNNANEKLFPFLKFERYIPRIWAPIIIRIGEPIKFSIGAAEEVILEKYIQSQIELFQDGAYYIKV